VTATVLRGIHGRYVIDASVALRWYLAEERNASADAVHERVVDEPEAFAVPELFGYEVFSVLFRLHPEPLRTFREGILPLLSSGILRYPLTEGISQKAATYVGKGLSGHDAFYVALAVELGALWLTFDSKAHSQLRQDHVSVDLGSGMPEEW
jgi:predicted nucleic acid-binding protein